MTENKDGSKKRNKSKQVNIELDFAKEITIEEHQLSLEQLAQRLDSDLKNGLSQSEAERRFCRDGPNTFTPPKEKSNWLILLKELTGGFAWISWFAAIGSLVIYFIEGHIQDLFLPIVLIIVIVVTAVYSFAQQRSSRKIFESFRNMIPQRTIVVRDGKQHLITTDQLVVGDLVHCKANDRIPADLRIISCEHMKVDNSSLTGESDPVPRSSGPVSSSSSSQVLEAENLAFLSTSCVDGTGIAVVIATGDRTVMGKITKLVTTIECRQSPINKEVNRFVLIIACLATTQAIIFFCICLVLKMKFFQSFIFMISIVVGNIPQGLLPAMTLGLTLTARLMTRKNCLIKYMEAVETLGSTSIICTDKTGTLTENRMTISHCYMAGRIVPALHHDRVQFFQSLSSIHHHCWEAFARCAMLCSRAAFSDASSQGFEGTESETIPTISANVMQRTCAGGDASEVAILRFMESISPVVEQYRKKYPKVAEKPFSSMYKYQYSIHRYTSQKDAAQFDDDEGNFFLVIKGAPERLIEMCATMIDENGQTSPLTVEDVQTFESAYQQLGSKGERVIALCDLKLVGFSPAANTAFNLNTNVKEYLLKNLRFLGLFSMMDPPRASVPLAVEKCKMAGIKVIMITGDHPITAQAIAQSVGIISSGSIPPSSAIIEHNHSNHPRSIVIASDRLASLTDPELGTIVQNYDEIVFARVSPQQKLRIVNTCQQLKHIVAVTGDGVNDSPALKRADIGVAMGITGSDVSKHAADIILLDDNFSSIVDGIEEGRKIFDNLKKIISYSLTGNNSTLWPFAMFLLFGIPICISPIMMVCIALGTDLVGGISLAFEQAESDIMRQLPRNPSRDRLVTQSLLQWSFFQGGIIVTASGYLGFFATMIQYGWMPWKFWQMRATWEEDITLIDSYGAEWTLEQRMEVMPAVQTSYFVAVVVAQWMDLLVHKTRRVSIFTQGFSNMFLNISLLAETAVACFLVYTPYVNEALSFAPVSWIPWVMGVPIFVFLLAYEELRKCMLRTFPTSQFLNNDLSK